MGNRYTSNYGVYCIASSRELRTKSYSMRIPIAVSRSLAWLWSALLVAPVFAQQIVPADGLGATFAQPQSTVTLQVVLQDSQGNPLRGQSVLFIAPSSRPCGEFTPCPADTHPHFLT